MLPSASSNNSIRVGLIGILLSLPLLLFGLPFAEAVVHGLDPSAWPPQAVTPGRWWEMFAGFHLRSVFDNHALLLRSNHPAFTGGGGWAGWGLVACWLGLLVTFSSSRADPDWRDPATLFGGARFADAAEIAGMRQGLEIGYAEGTDRIVRVEVEGNLLSIAPPRSGKTSGLIIPNLLAPDDTLSWQGAAVVIDPKGEVYKAVGRRRAALGRPVFVIDLRRGEVASGQWNPLVGAKASDALGLMRAARALVPEMSGESMYFRERAVSLLAGIIIAAMREGERGSAEQGPRQATPADVERLLNGEEEALALAQQGGDTPLLRSLARDLTLDERIRGSIISTAKLGTQWLLDPYLRRLTERSTIDVAAIARGRADLFLIVPTEHFETVSPLLRWFLSDLFTAVRRVRRPDDLRLLLIIDEAASLGGFSQLPTALGELPGLGLSIWTFWQSRAQIVRHYTEAGADLFGATAEFSTFSDVGGLDAASPEFFSRLLGDTTVDVPGSSEQTSGGSTSSTSRTTSAGKSGVRLVPPGDMARVTEDRLILLPNSRLYPRRPVRLEKTRYFEERRFADLADEVRPSARSG